MQSPNTQFGLQPAALKWLIALAAAVLIALALILAQGAPFDARAVAQPTPCPDAIACHALKRMPTQSAVNPAAP
jgi:hypothetical protein